MGAQQGKEMGVAPPQPSGRPAHFVGGGPGMPLPATPTGPEIVGGMNLPPPKPASRIKGLKPRNSSSSTSSGRGFGTPTHLGGGGPPPLGPGFDSPHLSSGGKNFNFHGLIILVVIRDTVRR